MFPEPLNQKFLAALVAVALALTGVLTGLKWLTVAALALWLGAMIYFGVGKRKS